MRIEDVINDSFTGDKQKNFLDFVAYAAENEMPLEYGDNNFWNFELGCINIEVSEEGAGFDVFISHDAFPDLPLNQREKEILWGHLRYCEDAETPGSCGCKHSPGSSKIIFGRKFDNLCSSWGIYSPDAETLDCMKRIVDAKAKLR